MSDFDWADEDDISEIEEMLSVIEAAKPPAPEDLGILSELGYKLRYGK